MNQFLTALRAAGESTRLRLLMLCAKGELAVAELAQVLGQSQPRISRHLKLLVDAGLLNRSREGAQVFYRLAESSQSAELGHILVRLAPQQDPVLARDQDRLQQIKAQRTEVAERYFNANAVQWEKIRLKYVSDEEFERTFLSFFAKRRYKNMLDIGTGTGRMLKLLASSVDKALGIDKSTEMLAVARATLELAEFGNIHLRQADMYDIPVENSHFDLVTINLVLHYSDNPQAVLEEASRVMTDGGILYLIDFAPHSDERLREEHNHRRLGFSDTEIKKFFMHAGLTLERRHAFEGNALTLVIWQAIKSFGV